MKKMKLAVYILAAALLASCNSSIMDIMEEGSTKHTVTYDANGATGGIVPEDEVYFKGDTFTVKENTGNLVRATDWTIKTSYPFKGWNTKADGSGTEYLPGSSITMGSDDITLHAILKPRAITEAGITASDGGYFGDSVSLSSDGNTLAVGAYGGNKVYISKWNGSAWIETGFSASDDASDIWFGFSVSLSSDGNTLAVGAPLKMIGTNNSQGKAYIYKWNGSAWNETGITASDGTASNRFAWSVSISSDGNTLAVGAYYKTVGSNSQQGKAYIYKWNGSTWTETGITASDGAANDHFGYSVSLNSNGNTLAVGAPNKTIGSNSGQGKAYIYKWNGSAWIETGITASDGTANNAFGWNVSLCSDGNTLAVGAPNKTIGSNSAQGKAYIYKWNGSAWIETGITSSDGVGFDSFGQSVSLNSDGNTLAVGAPHKVINSTTQQGKAYIYSWNGSAWTEEGITASDGAVSDQFGYSVSLNADGNTLAVGACLKDIGVNPDQGKVYIYR